VNSKYEGNYNDGGFSIKKESGGLYNPEAGNVPIHATPFSHNSAAYLG
jgi:hypothetical protein